jgi:hypothetical protein
VATPASRDANVDDEGAGWSLKSVITTILDFILNRPDPAADSP